MLSGHLFGNGLRVKSARFSCEKQLLCRENAEKTQFQFLLDILRKLCVRWGLSSSLIHNQNRIRFFGFLEHDSTWLALVHSSSYLSICRHAFLIIVYDFQIIHDNTMYMQICKYIYITTYIYIYILFCNVLHLLML